MLDFNNYFFKIILMHLALSTTFQTMTIHISAIRSSVNMNLTMSLNSVNKAINYLH